MFRGINQMNGKNPSKIIEILTSDLSLSHYDLTENIGVASDSSDTGIRAVILHKFKNEKMKAIAYTSRTLPVAEEKSSIYSSKKGIPKHTANRLRRWATILLD